MENSNYSNMIEKADEFVTGLDDLVSKKSSDDALAQVFDGNNEELVKMASMDILNLIGARLKDRNSEEGDVDEWHNLQSMLEYVVAVSSPKEMLIGLLSLLEIAQSDEYFLFVIQPLRTTLLRLPSHRGDTLLWAFNVLYDYVSNVPFPDYQFDLEDKEKMILENSPQLIRLETCASAILTFCEPFVSEAKECKLISSDEQRQEQIVAISTLLLKLVERPVAYFELGCSLVSPKDTTRNRVNYECANRLITMLFDLKADCLFNALEWHERGRLSLACRFTDDDADVNKLVSPVAFGALATLIYCYGISARRLPQVYNYEYIFERLLPSVNRLLKNGRNSILIGLGIDFLEFIADRQYFQLNQKLGESVAWEHQRLNESSYRELFLNLINVMVYCKLDKLRGRALKLFTRYVGFFEPRGQMLIIQFVFHMFNTQDNDDNDDPTRGDWYFANKGICGYLIDYYRGQLNKELSRPNGESPFLGAVGSMLSLFTKLDRLEETDFVDNFDRYMASLNLIRFLCIIDQNGRHHFPRQLFAKLLNTFVEPVRKGIEISKAHYQLDLKNRKEEMLVKKIIGNEAGGMDVEQMQILESAANNFDLMMSVVARVSELLELRMKHE